MQPNNSPYQLVPATLNTYSDSITADILNKENNHLFVFKLEALKVRFDFWVAIRILILFFSFVVSSQRYQFITILIFNFCSPIGWYIPCLYQWENSIERTLSCTRCTEGPIEARYVSHDLLNRLRSWILIIYHSPLLFLPFVLCRIKVTEKSDSEIVVVCGKNKAVVHAVPFKVDFYSDGVLSVTANAKGLFNFEHLRKKPVHE